MSPSDPYPDLSRRTFLRAGSGLIIAAVAGGCSSKIRSAPSTSDASGPTTTLAGAEPDPDEVVAAPAGATSFRAVRPVRIADTRRSGGWRRIDAGRVRVPVAGQAGVAATASAAAVRVGAAAGAADGAVTVVPAANGRDDRTRMVEAGPGSGAMCFVALGQGAVDVLLGPDTTDVTVDVLGYFEPSDTATRGGRLVTIDPAILVDTTRTARPFEPSETRSIAPDDAVPPGVLAVVVHVTATSTAGSTWTVRPVDVDDAPATVVIGAAGRRSASAVVPLTGGRFEVTASDGGHVEIVAVGFVTGDGADAATEGLYVPTPAQRLLDTRSVRQPVPDGSCREVAAGPEQCAALAVAVTSVAVTGAGATAVWGAGRSPSTAITATRGTVGAAASGSAVVPAGRRGIAIGSFGGDAHVVVDLYGWFVGPRSMEREPVLGSQPYGIRSIDMEPYAAEWLDYGMSTDGRPLRAFRHGSGGRVGLITTGLHGNEHTGTSVLADLITHDPIPGWTLWLVPIANPDARAANVRYAHDVDMNRDFPVDWNRLASPTSSGCVTTRTGAEPYSLVETRRLAAAMIDGPFRGASISISHHDNYNWVAPQSGSPPELRELATDYADATGLRRPGEGGSTVPTSPHATHVDGGFETFAHSLGMSSILVENKAGYRGGGWCAGEFGVEPFPDDVAPHHLALVALLTDSRLPDG